MSTGAGRVTNYDAIAGQYDRRYARHTYDGIRDTILNFLGALELESILDAGCGTGHWLQVVADRARVVAGLDVSAPMLARAREAAPRAYLVRGRSEHPPWRDASFDRIVCVNALHHFTDREQFFVEARRLLKPGGGLLSIGLDPHTARDEWWVYEYFPETVAIDRARFAPVRILRGEMTKADFAWSESFEADRLEAQRRLGEAFPEGVERGFTSQLAVLTDEEFARGVERLRAASEAAAKTGDDIWLTADLRFYATIGWVKP